MAIGDQLKACAFDEIPEFLEWEGVKYRQAQILKHDFFAASVLYQQESLAQQKLVLKLERQNSFFGIPFNEIGRWLSDREHTNFKHLQGISGIPRLVGKWGNNGLLYHYVEGQTLDEKPQLSEIFFDKLESLISHIHQRDMAYVDLNKRGNIILGDDGLPYLIDFQISWHGRSCLWGVDYVCRWLLKKLQAEDCYHIQKHKRRFRPDLMTPEEITQSRRRSFLTRIHNFWTRPFTRIRRHMLGRLYKKGRLLNDVTHPHPETNPARWLK